MQPTSFAPVQITPGKRTQSLGCCAVSSDSNQQQCVSTQTCTSSRASELVSSCSGPLASALTLTVSESAGGPAPVRVSAEAAGRTAEVRSSCRKLLILKFGFLPEECRSAGHVPKCKSHTGPTALLMATRKGTWIVTLDRNAAYTPIRASRQSIKK